MRDIPEAVWKVESERYESREFDNLNDALQEFERVKDYEMDNTVTLDSYVELLKSEDNFEDHQVIKRVNVVVDEERMSEGTPESEGFDFQWWAKWEEVED